MDTILEPYRPKISLESLKKTFEDIVERFSGGITAENITIVLVTVMNEIDKLKSLPGYEKKSLVTEILIYMVSIMAAEKDRETLSRMIRVTFPTLIDNIIEVKKGLTLKNIKNTFFCC